MNFQLLCLFGRLYATRRHVRGLFQVAAPRLKGAEACPKRAGPTRKPHAMVTALASSPPQRSQQLRAKHQFLFCSAAKALACHSQPLGRLGHKVSLELATRKSCCRTRASVYQSRNPLLHLSLCNHDSCILLIQYLFIMISSSWLHSLKPSDLRGAERARSSTKKWAT